MKEYNVRNKESEKKGKMISIIPYTFGDNVETDTVMLAIVIVNKKLEWWDIKDLEFI